MATAADLDFIHIHV